MNWLFSSLWQKKVWRINRSANRLLIASTNLDGFRLVNHGQFTKFTKLSPHQTSLLYGNVFSVLSPLAVFWYQILLSPVCLCIHFQVWFYFTFLHRRCFCIRFYFTITIKKYNPYVSSSLSMITSLWEWCITSAIGVEVWTGTGKATGDGWIAVELFRGLRYRIVIKQTWLAQFCSGTSYHRYKTHNTHQLIVLATYSCH